MEFPPKLRVSESCGACKHFDEEEGLCDLYQFEVAHNEVCNSFEVANEA